MPAPARCCTAERAAALTLLALLMAAAPAAAQTALCNRTSFVLNAAVGVEAAGAVATRGWFRLDPGQCRQVLAGDVGAEKLLLHARALPIYGRDAFAQVGHRELCVGEGEFLIAGATRCGAGQRPAPFTEVKPRAVEGIGLAVTLAEDADYAPDAARLAGLQRLLMLAGHDPGAVDGVAGPRTDGALAEFLSERGLPPETAAQPAVVAALVEQAGAPEGRGLTWCNDTRHVVMAALGQEDRAGILTRGWWRIEPGQCLKPDYDRREARRLFSFAEAVADDGRAIERGGRPLAWGGATSLCTRNSRFEVREQRDCAARGMDPRGFVAVPIEGRRGATVRFAE